MSYRNNEYDIHKSIRYDISMECHTDGVDGAQTEKKKLGMTLLSNVIPCLEMY